MPLIVICGLPSSGKTHRAEQIVADLQARVAAVNTSAGPDADTDSRTHASKDAETQARPNPPSSAKRRQLRVHYISDHNLHIPRNVYLTARAEKDARAQLYAAAKRALSADDFVVLDSGNYIKGYRYQLHCEAKALGTASCVVHVGTPLDRARQLNQRRTRPRSPALQEHKDGTEGGPEPTAAAEPACDNADGDGAQHPYSDKTWEELAMRFEEPNGMTRWDSPLFVVAWDDEHPPYEGIWTQMVAGPRNKDGTQRPIRPNQATVITPATASDHLYQLDRLTQAVVSLILDYQREHLGELGGTVSIPIASLTDGKASAITTPASRPVASPPSKEGQEHEVQHHLEISLPAAPLAMAQLQRLRRQFIALHRQQMGGLGMGAIGAGGGGLLVARVGKLFVDWLNDAFERVA